MMCRLFGTTGKTKNKHCIIRTGAGDSGAVFLPLFFPRRLFRKGAFLPRLAKQVPAYCCFALFVNAVMNLRHTSQTRNQKPVRLVVSPAFYSS